MGVAWNLREEVFGDDRLGCWVMSCGLVFIVFSVCSVFGVSGGGYSLIGVRCRYSVDAVRANSRFL